MTETKEPITRAVALGLLEAAVRDRGWNYIYVNPHKPTIVPPISCKYVHHVDGETRVGCIVGQVLVNGGYATLEELADNNFGNSMFLMSNMGIGATEDAVQLLRRAQKWQDKGVPWGAAVLMADQNVIEREI